MNKKILMVLLVLILGSIGAGGYFFLLKNKLNTFQTSGFNYDDPNQVFNIIVPADFDENKKQRLEEKISVAKDLYNTKKQETWTWITIGNIYEFIKDYDRAILAYEKSLSINSAELISLTNLGYIYEHYKNDFKKAEEYYLKALVDFPATVDNYFNLARLYEYRMSRVDDAEKVYVDGLKNTENNTELLVNLINFYQRQGKSIQAGEYAKLLLEANPDNELYKKDFSGLIK